MRFSNNFVSAEIYVMSKKSSWVKKHHLETARAKAQQRHRWKKGLFKKVVEFCLEYKSDVFGCLSLENWADVHSWFVLAETMVKYIVQFGMSHQGFSIIKFTLLGDMLPSSDPGDTRGYHAPAWRVFARSGRRVSFYWTLKGMTWTRGLLVNHYLYFLPPNIQRLK